ncbi:MAG TPA: Ni/Fe hydrogenase subunit gamma, partial [Candidatus Hydrogenedentes bacterium]|nr:Ni/Fe hydrogenase subunit gamma [Candidatus Hydrogenedentota bacterium]
PLEPAEENDVVIVAGGIGLAPMRPLVHALIRQRERYGHTTVLYGARTPEDILYRKELERWRGRFDMEVLVTVDRASRDWHGPVGVFTNLIPRAPFDPYYAVAYIAGPEVMMTYAVEALHRRGVRKDWQFVYMQRDLKRGVREIATCDAEKSGLTGPVFRFDEVEQFLAARE